MELNEWHLAKVITVEIDRIGAASFEIVEMKSDYEFVLKDSGNIYRVEKGESTRLMSLLLDEMDLIIDIRGNIMLMSKPSSRPISRSPKALPPF